VARNVTLCREAAESRLGHMNGGAVRRGRGEALVAAWEQPIACLAAIVREDRSNSRIALSRARLRRRSRSRSSLTSNAPHVPLRHASNGAACTFDEPGVRMPIFNLSFVRPAGGVAESRGRPSSRQLQKATAGRPGQKRRAATGPEPRAACSSQASMARTRLLTRPERRGTHSQHGAIRDLRSAAPQGCRA